MRELYGDRLDGLILFGPHARGEGEAGAPVDLLIVLRGDVDDWTETRRTSAVTAELSRRFGVLIARVVTDSDELANSDFAFFRRLRREGIRV